MKNKIAEWQALRVRLFVIKSKKISHITHFEKPNSNVEIHFSVSGPNYMQQAVLFLFFYMLKM